MDLPVAAALMVVEPGGCQGCGRLLDDHGVPLPDLSPIRPETWAILVADDDDRVTGDRGARLIWSELTSNPLDRRDFVTHRTPQTDRFGGRVDALDWYGTWKLFDLLLGCAIDGRDCDKALGNTPEQRFMGRWSDGVLVTEATVTDDPGPPA